LVDLDVPKVASSRQRKAGAFLRRRPGGGRNGRDDADSRLWVLALARD
jgi:hypothetical protein